MQHACARRCLARPDLSQPLVLSGPVFRGCRGRFLPFYRSEEHTSELQSLMRISYAVFCLKKKNERLTHNSAYLTLTTINTHQRHIKLTIHTYYHRQCTNIATTHLRISI